MNQPVLVSVDVVAAWMGMDRTDYSLPDEHTVEVRTRLLAEQLAEQPEGFVSPTPAPEPGRLVIWDVRWSATDRSEERRVGKEGRAWGEGAQRREHGGGL